MRTIQEKIINELGAQPAIDPEQEITNRANYLANYLGNTGLNGFVLGISGGQDSLLAGLLAQRAELLELPARHPGVEPHRPLVEAALHRALAGRAVAARSCGRSGSGSWP